ncbi:hypothetical protein R1sor_027211 [Riccia sorocarpa]|uniref:Endonuclease/exonuclease/phosphatase domain-containing protein n=1 Tax=Riccia sorocarpa TaxID=122646 RepID=A0ABD3GDJ6_9MARC
MFRKFEEQAVMLSTLSQEEVSVRKEVILVKEEMVDVKSSIGSIQIDLTGLLARVENQLCVEELKQIKDQLLEHGQVLQSLKNDTGSANMDIQPILSGLETHLKSYAEVALESQAALREQDVVRQQEMELKLQSFVVAAREAQTSALMEQDRERAARSERSLNIRIVGLEEPKGEDTKTVVTDLFRNTLKVDVLGVAQAFRVGKNERGPRTVVVKFDRLESRQAVLGSRSLWEDSDIVAMVETWCWRPDDIRLSGFDCLTNIWDAKKGQKGRGFGGIGVWVRTGLGVEVQLEYVNPKKQFLCIHLMIGSTSSFMIFGYFAPLGAPIYRDNAHVSPFENISQFVLGLKNRGPLWILGDFNSRTGPLQPGEDVHLSPPWGRTVDSDWDRVSEVAGRNAMVESFLSFLSYCSLTILNGSRKFRDTQACTFVGPAGSSLIDYLLANKEGRTLVQKMTLGQIVPESDHRFLCCEVAGFIPRRARRDPVNYLLTGEDRSVYAERLSKEITVNSTAVDVSSAILRVAKAVSLRRKVGRRAWYDVDCELARQKAIAASPEDRNGAFRKYKHFLRSKKRRFLQEEQKRLLQELRKDPKLFWGRIRAPGTKSELSPEVLMTLGDRRYRSATLTAISGWSSLRASGGPNALRPELPGGFEPFSLSGVVVVQSTWLAGVSGSFCLPHLFKPQFCTVRVFGDQVFLARKVEHIHKLFLQSELGVRPQTPYVLLLAETGKLPIEAEALWAALQLAKRVSSMPEERFP